MTQERTPLQHRHVADRIDRRTVLAGAAALGISSGVVAGAIAQTPKRGGHLVIGMSSASTTDSLDPTLIRSNFILALGGQVYDQLAVIDAHVEPKPALAESWEAKPGARDWIIKLRKGVIFHNGKEMTAADVVYSLNRHRSKESRSAVKVFVSSMSDVTATGKNEIAITLEGPNVDLPYILTLAQLVVVPEGTTNEGIGTGAFKLDHFEPGVRALVKRNANDWSTDRGFIDSVETIAFNDASARVNALLSGSVHLANEITPSFVQALEKAPSLQVFSIGSFSHKSFDMMTDTAPFDSVALRQALKYAIDRQSILTIQQRGYGKLGNDQPISPLDPFYAGDIPQRSYDPDKAKFLAAKAGFDGEIMLTVADAAFAGAIDMAQIFQSSAAKAGIKIQINRVSNDGYYSNVWNHQPFAASFWSGRPTPSLMFTHAYSSTSFSNSTHWKNPRFDQMLLAARAESDPQKRKQIYHDMQFMLSDEGGALIPMFINNIDAGQKTVKGFGPFPVYEMSGLRAAEKVWLET